MTLKAQLDEYRAGAAARFTEQQRAVMGGFHDRLAAVKRDIPKVWDVLPSFRFQGPGAPVTTEELFGRLDRLALIFIRGAW